MKNSDNVSKERALKIIEKAWAKYGADTMNSRLERIPSEDRLKTLGEWFKAQVGTRPQLKVVEASPAGVCIEISRCPTYEVCQKLGVLEICQKYCGSDYVSAQAIHPKVNLARDKEIVYGAACCNHCWVTEE